MVKERAYKIAKDRKLLKVLEKQLVKKGNQVIKYKKQCERKRSKGKCYDNYFSCCEDYATLQSAIEHVTTELNWLLER